MGMVLLRRSLPRRDLWSSMTAGAALVLALVAPAPARSGAVMDPDLQKGIELVGVGEYAHAIIVLDRTARRLDRQPSTRTQAAQAWLNLGIAYVGEGQEALARAALREAAVRDPALQLDAFEVSPKVRELFQKARDELAQRQVTAGDKGKGHSKLPWILGGVAVAGGGAALAASSSGGGSSPPSAGVSFGHEPLVLVVAVPATFSVGESHGLELASTVYEWDFGDGTRNSGATVQHTWQAGGSFNITLTAHDGSSQRATFQQTFTVYSLTGTWDGRTVTTGETFLVRMTQTGAALGGDADGVSFTGSISAQGGISLTPSCGGPWSGRISTGDALAGYGFLPCQRSSDSLPQELNRRR